MPDPGDFTRGNLRNIINSYLMDAMCSPKGKKKKVDSKKQGMDILDQVTKASTKKGKKIGVEKREELKGENTVGEFVRFDGKPVHLALFPDIKTEDIRIV